MANTIVSSETFQYGDDTRKRVTELTCPIKAVSMVKRDNFTATPLPLVHSDDKCCDFRIEHTDGGHLVGLSLGGENTHDNVVPMYCGFNRYHWRLNIEKKIDKADASTSKKLKVRIKIKYQASDPRIPAAFDVKLEELDSAKVVKDFGTIVHSAPVALDETAAQGDKETIEQMLVTSKDWSLKGYLEAQGKAQKLPEKPGPYAVLDYMLFVKNFFPKVKVGNGRNFSAEQRRLILLVNPLLHKTKWVASDDESDKYQKLTDFGDSGAEIDHIWPKGKSGSNAFSNARCVSSSCNKSKLDSI